MNILPHKSWNPWSSKNVEKVLRDEAKAKEEEEQLLEKAALVVRHLVMPSLLLRGLRSGSAD
jgi:hypothetical protein